MDDGVAKVEALLEESKMEAADDTVLLWLADPCEV